MWVGLILTSIVAIPVLVGILAFIENYENNNTLSLEDYRIKVNKEERRWVWGEGLTFQNEASEETVLKYNQYIAKRKNKKILSWIVSIFISIILIIAFTWLGSYIEKEKINGQIKSYISAKTTIEMSLENENIGGLERIELVQQAKEKNEWLANMQYQAKQWYRFYWDKGNILNVEFINL